MDFTLDATGAKSVGDGIGNMLKAFAMGPSVRAKAANEAALRDAQTYSANMLGNDRGAQARQTMTQTGYMADPLTTVMTRLLIPQNQRGAVEQKLQTGSFGPQFDPLPEGVAGPALPAPVADDTMRQLGDYLAAAQMMYGTGSNVAQAGDFELDRQTAGIRDQAVANVGDIDMMNRLNTLAQPGQTYMPMENVGNTGRGFNKATGQGNTIDATLAKIFDDGERAGAYRDRAAGDASMSTARQNDVETGVMERTGARPGSGAEGSEGALSAVITRTLQVPMLDSRGRVVTNPLTGAVETQQDLDATQRFYRWVNANGARPTAKQFADWEAQGRPDAPGRPSAAGAPAAPAPGQNVEREQTLPNGKTYVKINGQWFEK